LAVSKLLLFPKDVVEESLAKEEGGGQDVVKVGPVARRTPPWSPPKLSILSRISSPWANGISHGSCESVQ